MKHEKERQINIVYKAAKRFRLKPKRFEAVALLLAALLMIAAGCGKNDTNTTPSPTSEASGQQSSQSSAVRVVTSFYPLYFLATEIGGEHVEVENLIAAGVEPHDWTPKSKDLTIASNAQLFLYHGVGLESWADDFFKGLSKDSTVVIKEMSKGISLIHGDEEEHEEEEHADEHGHSHSHAIDPHTWVSPKSALLLAENVKLSLIEVDADHKADYERNYEVLKKQLESLDEEYTAKLSQVSQKNMVVSHQAFGYLARDYGLKQLTIMGLSPDAEPLAQDILRIANFVKDNGVKYIFFEELVSDQLANMLASEAKVDTMVLNPLEGLTKEQEQAGETYVTLMERNLQNLIQALQ